MSNTGPSSTVAELSAQWKNPNDVLSLLLIIGGDVVQTALAQTSGGWITPVCFSFGWVAYSFSTLVRVLGDGRLLPPPDFPAKVFNLESSYVRENKNWVVGRILRDNELFMNKREQHAGKAIRISVYIALPREEGKEINNVRTTWVWLSVTLLQIGIASIPLGREREWGVFLVTCSGIIASMLAGALPQWRIEKVPLRTNSRKYIALTSGNGSRDIMVIYGDKNALDLEELAAGESPRTDRVWEALSWFSKPMFDAFGNPDKHKNGVPKRRAAMRNGLPIGVWVTRFASFVQVVFWLALLIMVAGLKSHSWYLIGVGSVGMLQNAVLAATARRPGRRGLPMTLVDVIIAHRVMDGLMDLDCTIPGAGLALRDEYFPGFLRETEFDWWSGEREAYDLERLQDRSRGTPRSRLPWKPVRIPPIDMSGKAYLYRRATSWGSNMNAGVDAEAVRYPPLPVQLPEGDLSPTSAESEKPTKFQAARSMHEILRMGRLPKVSRASTMDSTIRSPDWA